MCCLSRMVLAGWLVQMPPRMAHMQRLHPCREAVLMRGSMDRKDSGLLGVTIRSFYLLAGALLYEYKASTHSRACCGTCHAGVWLPGWWACLVTLIERWLLLLLLVVVRCKAPPRACTWWCHWWGSRSPYLPTTSRSCACPGAGPGIAWW